MASVREGHRAALVVVDVQVGVMAECDDAARAVTQVSRAVARARARGAPVLWVQHDDEQMPRDSAAWQWAPELVPADGDLRLYKQFNSAFENTPLEAELARLGITQLVLAGAASNWCIRATAYAALDRGYDLTLVSDAHTTGSMTLKNGQRIEAARVIDDLNVTMTWLRYPGRRSAAVPVDELDFSRLPPLPVWS